MSSALGLRVGGARHTYRSKVAGRRPTSGGGGAQGAKEGLGLLPAITAGLEMGLEERHQSGDVFTPANALCKFIQDSKDILTGALLIAGSLKKSCHLDRVLRPYRRARVSPPKGPSERRTDPAH